MDDTQKTIAKDIVEGWKNIVYADEYQADAALVSLIICAMKVQDRDTRQLCAEAILEIDSFTILDNTRHRFIDGAQAFAACLNARTP